MLGTGGHRVFSSLMTNLNSWSAPACWGLVSKNLETNKKNCQIDFCRNVFVPLFPVKMKILASRLAGCAIFINCKSKCH